MKILKTYVPEEVHEFYRNIDENLFDYSDNPTENIDINYSIRSTLRYPGGKTRGVEFITQFFPKNLDKLLSPFFGGGSIKLSAAAKGTTVYGYDIFFPLVEFWQCLTTHPIELATEVEKYGMAKKKG